jgi:hypothetical protein
MVQNETVKVLSLSYVDFRTGPKAQGQPDPNQQMGYGPKVEARGFLGGPMGRKQYRHANSWHSA